MSGRHEGSMSGARNPGAPGTCRLYMAVSRMDDSNHGFIYFWADNPHTFAGLQSFCENNVRRFSLDGGNTPPVLVCLNVDVPADRIVEHTMTRLNRPQVFAILEETVQAEATH